MKGHTFNQGENVMTKANPIVNVVVKSLVQIVGAVH
jgi:hypothetical protein